MNLSLTKPIVFFDLETTGLNISKDRIVEISILKVLPDLSEIIKTYLVNPEIPIPEAASAIHGIFDKDVKNSPCLKDIASEIIRLFTGADVAGYNSNRFDVPLLLEEFDRIGIDFDITKSRFVDIQVIFHKQEPRDLQAAYKTYCGKELLDAHSAEADTRATYEILKSQLDRYDNLENDINFLSEFSQGIEKKLDVAGRIVLNKDDKPVFNFGKHKGQEVSKIFAQQPNYYDWIMNADFPSNTKKIFTEIRLGRL